jgi:ribosomal protein S18 acetylase RimI-like enzyme
VSDKIQVSEAGFADLNKIVACHRAAFPGTLSTKLGLNVSRKMLEWYLVSDKRFLLWITDGARCLGYAGGMIADGTQVHGSASGTIQYAFKEIVRALIVRPWLWFHSELAARYSLIARNLYYRLVRYQTPVSKRQEFITPHVSLIVIGVHPEFQGKGMGDQLLKAFEQKSIALGYRRLSLTVLANNIKALSSYNRNGWQIVERVGVSMRMEKCVEAKL